MKNSTTKERDREITIISATLSEKAEELHNRLGLLLDRLTPLMREEEKKPEGAVTRKGFGCQFARDLETIEDKLAAEVTKVNAALERIEI